MAEKSAVDEAVEGLQKAKKELKTVSSWIFAHPEVWSGEVADDLKDQINDIIRTINDLKESIKEGATEETEGE